MTFREFIVPPPTLFRSDPQSVEVVTGWYIATLGFWCWLGGWFGTFLPNLSAVQGWEWVVAALVTPYGVHHAMKAHSRNLHRRAMQAFWASGVFFAFALVIWQNQSWRIPGFPALVLGSIVQGWCYLRLKRVIA